MDHIDTMIIVTGLSFFSSFLFFFRFVTVYCYWLIILFFFSLFFRFVTVAYATLCVSLRLPDKSCQLLFSRISGECLVDLLLQGELFSVVVGSVVLNDAVVLRHTVLVVRTNGVLTFVLNVIMLVVL